MGLFLNHLLPADVFFTEPFEIIVAKEKNAHNVFSPLNDYTLPYSYF